MDSFVSYSYQSYISGYRIVGDSVAVIELKHVPTKEIAGQGL